MPLRYRVPADAFPEGVWAPLHSGGEMLAKWPVRCPGWYNVDMQPTNRAALTRRAGAIEVPPSR